MQDLSKIFIGKINLNSDRWNKNSATLDGCDLRISVLELLKLIGDKPEVCLDRERDDNAEYFLSFKGEIKTLSGKYNIDVTSINEDFSVDEDEDVIADTILSNLYSKSGKNYVSQIFIELVDINIINLYTE